MLPELISRRKKQILEHEGGLYIMLNNTWLNFCVKKIINADLIYNECRLLPILFIFDNYLYKVS